ncbi:WD40 repeat domain-containing protein, partial [Spirulina sp. 06S082]
MSLPNRSNTNNLSQLHWVLRQNDRAIDQWVQNIQITDIVTSAALSPDNQIVVGGSWKKIWIWDIQTGRIIKSFTKHNHWILSIAISPDRDFFVSASADQTIKIWDLSSYKLLYNLEGHTNGVTKVKISLNGKKLISASLDQTIKVWDLQTGNLIKTLTGHSGEIWSLAISEDSNFVVSGSEDKTIKIWDLESGTCLDTLNHHSDCVQAIAICFAQKILISGGKNGEINIWKYSERKNRNKSKAKKKNLFSRFVNFLDDLFQKPKKDDWLTSLELDRVEKENYSINDLVWLDRHHFLSACDESGLEVWGLKNKNNLQNFWENRNFSGIFSLSKNDSILAIAGRNWIEIWYIKQKKLLCIPQGCSHSILKKLCISQHPQTIEFEQSYTFQVKGIDQNNCEIEIHNICWSATNGTINQNGVFTASRDREYVRITASLDNFKDTTYISVVEPPRLSYLSIKLSSNKLKSGQKIPLYAEGIDQYGNAIATGELNWYATSGSIENNQFIAGNENEIVYVTATSKKIKSIQATTKIEIVVPPKLSSLKILLPCKQLKYSQKIKLRVRGIDQYGKKIDPGTVKWKASSGKIKKGKYQASRKPEVVTLTAIADNIQTSVQIEVIEPPQLSTLEITPSSSNSPIEIQPSTGQKFTVVGRDQRGNLMTVKKVCWETTAGQIDEQGNLMTDEYQQGEFYVTARVNNITASAKIYIPPFYEIIEVPESPEIVELKISPDCVETEPDEYQLFTLSGFDHAGNLVTINSAIWSCAQGGKISQAGIFRGGYKQRYVTVTATVGNISSTAEVTILPVLRRLKIIPNFVELKSN